MKKYILIFIPFILVSTVFIFSCGKKSTTPISSIKNIPVQTNFNFLVDTINPSPPLDSLYTFQKEINLNPNGFSINHYGEMLWNQKAQVFITRREFNVFNKDFKKLYTYKKHQAAVNYSFEELPLAIVSDQKNLIFIDLETFKVKKEYALEGFIHDFQKLPNNQILATATKNDTTLYQYFFEETTLVKKDSVNVPTTKAKFVFDPSLKYVISPFAAEVKVLHVEDNTTRIIDNNRYSHRPLFTSDGTRMIITETGITRDRVGHVKIFTFPELREIYSQPFYGRRVTSLKDSLLVVGDKDGNVEIIDVQKGETVFSQKGKQRITVVSMLNDHEILYGEMKNKKLSLNIKDFSTNQMVKSVKFNTHFIIPIDFSSDSKSLYVYYNKAITKIDLASGKTKDIRNDVPNLSRATINSDGKYMVFQGKKLHSQLELLNLENGELEAIPSPYVSYLFGQNPNELIIFYYTDSIKTFNIQSKQYSQKWDKSFNPRIGSVLQKKLWKNPKDNEEWIVKTERSRRKRITYFDSKTYETIDSFDYSHYRPAREFIGIDKNGNHYLCEEYSQAYCYNPITHEIIDSFPGQFNPHFSKVLGTKNREAFYTRQNGIVFIFAPHNSNIYQSFDFHEFYWFSDDLEYFVFAKGDKLTIYQWN